MTNEVAETSEFPQSWHVCVNCLHSSQKGGQRCRGLKSVFQSRNWSAPLVVHCWYSRYHDVI